MRNTSHLLKRATLLLFVVTFGLFGLTGTASAADTWVPTFDPNVHVYVSPELKNHPTQPFTLDPQFESDIKALAARHNLDVYVVATVQGDDITGDRKRWAPDFLHNLFWQKWTAQGLKEDRAIVILWVRGSANPAQMSTGVRVGPALHALGITRQRLFDQTGPVITALKAHMPGDPPACFKAIVENINGEIDRAQQGQTPASTTPFADDSGESGGIGWFWILVFIFGGGALLLCISIGAASARARREMEEQDRQRQLAWEKAQRERRNPEANGGTNPQGNPPGTNPQGTGGTDATTIAGAALGGAVLGHVLTRETEKKKKDTGSSSGSSDSGTTAGGGCSSGSGDSGGGGGGGGGCGGGGCGGGGCGGGGCGGG